MEEPSSSTEASTAKHKPPRGGHGMWSPAVLAKYWAIQLPPTVLVVVILLVAEEQLLEWPQWIVWTIAAVWFAKDAVLYPFVWRAYDPNPADALPYPTQGARGVAVEPIDPAGAVRVWGELWRAELSRGARRIEEGEAVQVKHRRGLTLIVEPASPAGKPRTHWWRRA